MILAEDDTLVRGIIRSMPWLNGLLACEAIRALPGYAGVYRGRFSGLSPVTAATGQLTAATLLMLPLVTIVDRPWLLPGPSMATWASLATTAVLCTAATSLGPASVPRINSQKKGQRVDTASLTSACEDCCARRSSQQVLVSRNC